MRIVCDVTFHGWNQTALEFYEGLEADNSKSYWTAHKATYDNDVLAPMRQLLDELSPRYGETKVFRPYRDVRFSPDKSPYKTAIGATTSHGGYVQLSSHGLAAGAGYYQLASDQLSRYRDAVDDEKTGQQLVDIVSHLASEHIEIMSIDVLKTAPRGMSADHPRIELLRQKGLAAWRQWPIAPLAGHGGSEAAHHRLLRHHPTAGGMARRKCRADDVDAALGPVGNRHHRFALAGSANDP